MNAGNDPCANCTHPRKRHHEPTPSETDRNILEGCSVRGAGHGWRCPCPGFKYRKEAS